LGRYRYLKVVTLTSLIRPNAMKKESDYCDVDDENQNFKQSWMAIDLVNLDGNQ